MLGHFGSNSNSGVFGTCCADDAVKASPAPRITAIPTVIFSPLMPILLALRCPYYNPRHANNKTRFSCGCRVRERRAVCDSAVVASGNAGALEARHRRGFFSDTTESRLTGRTYAGLSG